MANLSRWHYGFISVNANILLTAFRANLRGRDFLQLVRELASPLTSKESALQVGSGTVWALLNDRGIDYRLCLKATETVLDTLTQCVEARYIVIHMFRKVLRRRLTDPPAQAIYIELFRKVLWYWADKRGLLNELVDAG